MLLFSSIVVGLLIYFMVKCKTWHEEIDKDDEN